MAHWYERLGLNLRSTPQQAIWVHAVSVGESSVAIPLIRALQHQQPSIPIVVTNETYTGAQCINSALGQSVSQLYFPFDVPLIISRYIKKLNPRMLILLETELWPNLLAECQRCNIPVILANARLSPGSAKGYARFPSLTRAMLQSLALLLAQTAEDAQRFMALGATEAQILITGNVKFDIKPSSKLIKNAERLKVFLGNQRPIFIAASTHKGEEEQILQAFKIIKKKIPELLLISAPRHTDRADYLKQYYQKQGFKVINYSDIKSEFSGDIVILNKMGKLLELYAVADIAFIGGSLVKKGGQNPLEAVWLELPILIGPYTYNFAFIVKQLLACGAGIQIQTTKDLVDNVLHLMTHSQQRKRMGEKGKIFLEKNTGAVQKQLTAIEKLI